MLGPVKVEDANSHNNNTHSTGLNILPTTVQDTPQAINVIDAAQTPENFIGPITIHSLPAIAGRVTHLGQIPWLADNTFAANLPDAGAGDGV